jgi:hypothetical protein
MHNGIQDRSTSLGVSSVLFKGKVQPPFADLITSITDKRSSINTKNSLPKNILLNFRIMSKVIAVAGGTGSVGRTIVDELEKSSLYDAIVLARNVSYRKSRDTKQGSDS